jgi:hypothetical protein
MTLLEPASRRRRQYRQSRPFQVHDDTEEAAKTLNEYHDFENLEHYSHRPTTEVHQQHPRDGSVSAFNGAMRSEGE